MNKIKILLATISTVLCSISASAHDFEVEGIYYDKMVYSLNPSVSVTYGEGFRYQGSITIPETVTYEGVTYSVTSIGALAFSYCDGLTSVKIPNSVKNINAEAFSGCAGLTAITFPGSLTEINSNAFYGCTGLLSIAIPKNLTSIEPSAFSNCI